MIEMVETFMGVVGKGKSGFDLGDSVLTDLSFKENRVKSFIIDIHNYEGEDYSVYGIIENIEGHKNKYWRNCFSLTTVKMVLTEKWTKIWTKI